MIPLHPVLPAATRLHPMIRQGAVVVAGIALMTLAARVQIPFWPVPMTLHTLAVMGFAVALGPRLATLIFAGYLAAGAMGLPVFSGAPLRGVGLAYMAGPTGGYLAGYLIASGLVGWLAAGRGVMGRTGAMLAGLGVVYAAGTAWLAGFVAPGQVFALGVAPFLAGDLVKIALVAIAPALLRRLRA